MKTADELKAMLYDRIAELQQGVQILAYEDQLRTEIALLSVILEDDIEAEQWAVIEASI